MSDILLKSIHFPQLDARYIVGDDTLSEEGAAADAKETGDALALKADKTDTYTKEQVDDKVGDAKTELEEAIEDLEERKAETGGYYETFTSGQANQLIATEAITDTEPYNFRKTGGPNDVGDRVYDTLVGGSVVWNQLVASGATEVTVPNGHKYYANINGTKSIGASTGTAISINDSAEDNIIDLTAALGSTIADYVYTLETATAGAGVAWFRKYFPGIYYGFAEPHFEHVQTSAKETVGFNQFDEDFESGDINNSGVPYANADYKRSKNFSDCLPNTVYYKYCATRLWMFFYDSEQNFIEKSSATNNKTVTTPQNARYFKVVVDKNAGEACINLHGDRDGEYEAYKKRTYPLDSSLTLRGIPKLDSANRLYFDGDIYRHDGSGEQRYLGVDLGTINWQKVTGNNYATFSSFAGAIDIKYDAVKVVFTNYGKYAEVTSNTAQADADNYIWINASKQIRIKDTSKADMTAEQFKAAMSGVFLTCEKATPEPFTAEPYQYPMVVDPLGTEAFVDYAVEQGERDAKIPVGHSSSYPADLRGKLQRLPSPTGTNGDYIVTEIDGKLYLKPYVPAVGLTMTAPTTEGEGE